MEHYIATCWYFLDEYEMICIKHSLQNNNWIYYISFYSQNEKGSIRTRKLPRFFCLTSRTYEKILRSAVHKTSRQYWRATPLLREISAKSSLRQRRTWLRTIWTLFLLVVVKNIKVDQTTLIVKLENHWNTVT